MQRSNSDLLVCFAVTRLAVEDLSRAVAPLSPHSLDRGDERFRLLVDSVEDYAIVLLDPAGNVVTWNVGAERIKGYHGVRHRRTALLAFLPAIRN